MDWKLFLPILVPALTKMLDEFIKGEKLTAWQIKALQMAYGAALVFGEEVVADSENTLDDAALELFKNLTEDTAKEGEFPLLVLAMVGE